MTIHFQSLHCREINLAKNWRKTGEEHGWLTDAKGTTGEERTDTPNDPFGKLPADNVQAVKVSEFLPFSKVLMS